MPLIWAPKSMGLRICCFYYVVVLLNLHVVHGISSKILYFIWLVHTYILALGFVAYEMNYHNVPIRDGFPAGSISVVGRGWRHFISHDEVDGENLSPVGFTGMGIWSSIPRIRSPWGSTISLSSFKISYQS